MTLPNNIHALMLSCSMHILVLFFFRFGRRIMVVSASTVMFIVNIIMPFSYNAYMFIVLRFLDGTTGMVFYSASFIIGILVVYKHYSYHCYKTCIIKSNYLYSDDIAKHRCLCKILSFLSVNIVVPNKSWYTSVYIV